MTTPSGLVRAVWSGPFPADMGPGQPTLLPGHEYEITPEMAESAHWTVDDSELEAARAAQDAMIQQAGADVVANEEAKREAAAQAEAEAAAKQREETAATEAAEREAAAQSSGSSGSGSSSSGSSSA